MDAKRFNKLLKKIKYDRSAFEEIYNEYAGPLKATLIRKFGNKTDAEDIVHEVFLKLFDLEETVSKPMSFLSTMASRLAIDAWRHKHGEVLTPIENGCAAVVNPQAMAILEFLDELPRKIVYLHFWEKYPYAEIAEILGMTPVNARVVAHRALRKLQAMCNKKKFRNVFLGETV